MLSRRRLLAAAPLCAAPLTAFARETPPDAAPADAPASPPPPIPQTGEDGVIHLPIQVTHNVPWTWVWLNGQGPYRFTLDTGDSAGYTIARGLAAKLALPHAFGVRMSGVTGEGSREAFIVKDVVVGGVLKDSGRVFVPEISGGFSSGLLPAQLLRLLPCDLDFGEGELRLYQKRKPSHPDWDRLPLRVLDSNPYQPPPAAFVTDVLLDGETYRLGIDTGDTEGLTLFASTVRRRNLWNRYPKRIESGVMGVMQVARERLVRLQSLKIGDSEIPNPVVGLIDPEAHNAETEMDGLIGMETLRRFALSFDAGENALFVKPNAALRQPFHYNRSGMTFRVQEGRRVVASLVAGAPAAKAGLQVGDIIEKTGSDFAWRLRDVPGAVIEFEMERSGQRQPVRLVLAELI